MKLLKREPGNTERGDIIWLDNTRIVAISAVVLLHVAADLVMYEPLGTNRWWMGNIFDSLVRWCVPVFVMVSGALLLDPNKEEELRDFYHRRASRLLVPLIVWSIAYLLWLYLKKVMKGDPVDALFLVKKLMQGRPYYHMWFLYMLISMYAFTPFFRKIVSKSSHSELMLLVAVSLTIAILNSLTKLSGNSNSSIFINLFLSYVPYFFLGYLVRTSQLDCKPTVLWMGFVLTAIMTSLGCYLLAIRSGLGAGLYWYDDLSLSVVPMATFVALLLRKFTIPIWNKKVTKGAASLTLGVYLVHPFILDVFRYKIYVMKTVHPAISIPLTTASVLSVSFAFSWIISKVPYIRRTI